jgi:hypothetical protein
MTHRDYTSSLPSCRSCTPRPQLQQTCGTGRRHRST